jgi:hypothetical protein
MANLVTVAGGAKAGISTLSPAEHHAAISALSKLSAASGATHGVASALGGTLRSATLSGGSVHSSAGHGADTFAGGVHSGATPAVSSLGSDTVVAGSAFKPESTAASVAKSHPLSLSGDTINVAGTTAATVKSETVHDAKAGHTITLSDKTTITLTGVAPHDVTKPH